MIVQSPFYLSVDDIPHNVNFAEFIIRHTKKFGDAVALVDAVSKWNCSYNELAGHVARFQKNFENAGIRNGDHVALICFNCPEFILANLAITTLGAISVCINPLGTSYEYEYFLNLAECKHAVVHPNFEKGVIDVKDKTNSLKNIVTMPTLTSTETLTPNLQIKGTSRCFIMNFSSGTTGKPKAVQSFQRSLVANVVITSQTPWNPRKTDKQERSLMVIPLHHGYGGILVYQSMYSGHSVVTMPRYKPREFLQTLQDYQITTAFLVAPIIQFLATSPMVSNFDLKHFKSITSGASPLAPEIAQLCRSRLKMEDVRMIYGMSEIRTPTWTPYGSTNHASIGVLLPNSKLKIVNQKTGEQCLEAGQIGELWFTGVQVVEGEYFRNKEANESFYKREGDTIWARTGDCGYFDRNGFIYLTDRYKELIKYKGFQVSPSEIEQFLRTHPDVIECAVVGRPDLEAGEVPTAFIVPKENADKQKMETDLKRLIKEKLSTYKQLKGGIYFVAEIPRSASGKLSRASLFKNLQMNSKL